MLRHGVPIGRVLGIAIDLDYSWFLIVALLTWMLAVSYFPREFADWTAVEYWIVGFSTAILLFVSVLVHELAHAAVALHFALPVPRITLFLFGGVSQIAEEPAAPGVEFWIAVVGPITSLAIAAFCWEIEPLCVTIEPVLAVVKYIALLNFILAIFNLIPGFPLDGGRVLRAVLWKVTHSYHRATVAAGLSGRFFGYLLIFYGIWQVFIGNMGDGIWAALIGWFLESAAASQLQQESIKGLLSGHRVVEAMQRNFIQIDGERTVQELLNQSPMQSGSRYAVVAEGGAPAGMVTLADVQKVPAEAWPTTRVDQVMTPLNKVTTTDANALLWSALERMGRDGVNQLPVVQGNWIVGVLSRDDILHYLTGLRGLQASA